MATTTQKFVRTSKSSGGTPSDVQALVDAYNRLEARFEALLAKLDLDAGVTDTNYAALINAAEPNALILLSPIQ